jgi:hypothetical protein
MTTDPELFDTIDSYLPEQHKPDFSRADLIARHRGKGARWRTPFVPCAQEILGFTVDVAVEPACRPSRSGAGASPEVYQLGEGSAFHDVLELLATNSDYR